MIALLALLLVAAPPSSPLRLSSMDGGTTFTVIGTVTANAGTGTMAVSVAALPLPSGAATAAKQDTGNTSLSSIDSKTPALVSGRQPVDGSGVTQPVSGPVTDAQLRASAVPVSLASVPTHAVTGTFFQATQPVSLASMPSTPVTGTFWQATQPVSGTFWQATQPISGTVTANAGTGTMAVSGPVTDAQLRASAVPVSLASVPSHAVTGTFWQATQPVSGPATDAQMRATPLIVQEGGSTRWSCFVPLTTTVMTQCRAAPAGSLRAYVTSVACSNGAATVQGVDVVFGTGSNCATVPTALTHKFQMGTAALTTSPFLVAQQFPTPLVPTAANAICVRPTAATAFGCTLTGYDAL